MPNYSSKHYVNLMVLLQMTVKIINVNNNVLFPFSTCDKDCVSLDTCIDHVLGHNISIIFDHDSLNGQNFAVLHGIVQCQNVVNGILANAPNPANTSAIMGYLWSDGSLGSNTMQKDNSIWVITVTLSLLP